MSRYLGKKRSSKKPPQSFRPLLWSLRWSDIDVQQDKHDIIVNTINDGTIKQWRWLIDTYGKRTVRSTIKKRLATEFHPESLHLAREIFGIRNLPYARRGFDKKGHRHLSQTGNV
jgi:hypothetical protein